LRHKEFHTTKQTARWKFSSAQFSFQKDPAAALFPSGRARSKKFRNASRNERVTVK